MKLLPLTVSEWEGAAMFAGRMTRKRVPPRVRWKPKDKPEEIVTARPFAMARPGALFWVAEPFVWWQGRGFWEPMEHIDYGHGLVEFSRKPAKVSRWKRHTKEAHQMWRGASRMTVEITAIRYTDVAEISDADTVAEAMVMLSADNPRSRFLAFYEKTFGPEFGSPLASCIVVDFDVHKENIGVLLAARGAA